MGCKVARKSAMLEKIWKIQSEPYWFQTPFPILTKEKKKKKVLGSALMFTWINS